MRSLLPPILLLLLVFLGVGPGCARGRFPDDVAVYRELVARIDSNGDGVISDAEYEPYAAGRLPFAQIDTNGNGSIDIDELAAAVAYDHPGFVVSDETEGTKH